MFKMSDQHERDYLVWSDARIELRDARVLAQKDLAIDIAGSSAAIRTQKKEDWITNMFYTCEGCDMFPVESIKKQWAVE